MPEVRLGLDSRWLYVESPERAPYPITGKYLFFSKDDPVELLRVACREIKGHGFHAAKIALAARPNFVLCLYDRDDSRKRELRGRYPDRRPAFNFGGWKTEAATAAGVYSDLFRPDAT
jgi:hypothetical protein